MEVSGANWVLAKSQAPGIGEPGPRQDHTAWKQAQPDPELGPAGAAQTGLGLPWTPLSWAGVWWDPCSPRDLSFRKRLSGQLGCFLV